MPVSLLQFFEHHYVIEREVRESTAAQYRIALRLFVCWFGEHFNREPLIHEITREHLNQWIVDLQRQHPDLSPHTIKSKQRSVRTILNQAFELEFLPNKVERLRSVRVPETIKDVWSGAEVLQLIKTCDCKELGFMRGRFPYTRIRRRAYMKALFSVMWDTALRRDDICRLPLSYLLDPAPFSVVQTKTGRTVSCRISDSTRRAVAATVDEYSARDISGNPRELAFPCWYHPDAKRETELCAVSRLAVRIMKRAGLETSDGPLKKLRRSSVTYAARKYPGQGYLRAGHTNSHTTDKHYENKSVSIAEIPAPPDLDEFRATVLTGSAGAA